MVQDKSEEEFTRNDVCTFHDNSQRILCIIIISESVGEKNVIVYEEKAPQDRVGSVKSVREQVG